MSDDMSMGLPSSAGEHGVLRSMQEVAMSSQEASKMLRTYNIAWWGNNYYDVNELGHISVCPDPDVPEARVDLAQLVKTREAQGQRLPALFCFPQILQHRLRSINAAFKRARESYGYNGDYFLVYPIKVNQHRRVIESLIHSGEPLGLEAGSKAELMAVLAHAGMTRSVIVCNGYKDREYIRLALIGEKMGHKVYLVIEKMSEIAIVLDEAERLNVVPRLGVRARLASQGSGKWQSSGGEKSKFGLAATQVLQLVETLREAGRLDSLQLLHFHLGSQMANIRDIATGVRESARFYVELHKLGVNIQCFDVGGGLGVAIAYPQAKALHEAGCEVDLIVGFRNEHLIILKDELAAACTDLTIMTDDGSNGNKGFVTQALQAKLDAGKAYDEVIAIGPLPMMKAVCDLTKPKDIKTIVSMNPIMIDGTGMCGGCRVTVGGVTKFACVDGPDFDGHQVDWAEAISRSRMFRPEEQRAMEKLHKCRLTGGVR